MRDPAGIAAAIQAADSVCVCGHVNPDGDAVGSALAMRLILMGMGKKVRVFFQDKIPDYLSFLTGVDDIRKPETNTERYDLFLALDSSEAIRMGACVQLMKCCTRTAQIDHHGTNPGYADVNSIDADASATRFCAEASELDLRLALKEGFLNLDANGSNDTIADV